MKNYEIIPTSRFKRDLKTALRRGLDIKTLDVVIELLRTGEVIPEKYRDHALVGNWRGYRECHIAPDWLLIYKADDELLVIALAATGTHADLFKR